MQVHTLKIEGFRSLKSLHMPKLRAAVVLHGDNNSGKSNILAALKSIFESKYEDAEIELGDSELSSRPAARRTVFWQGVLPGFSDNYYLRGDDSIEFSVKLQVGSKDVESISSDNPIKNWVKEKGTIVELVGQFERRDDDALFRLLTVTIDKKGIYSYTDNEIEWLEGNDSEEADRQKFVEEFLNLFNDCVEIVPADRFLTNEVHAESMVKNLNSAEYKNWLFSQFLDRDGYLVFERISGLFSNKPFNFGDISFTRDSDTNEIEIMIDDGKTYRMPITSKGTGLQQLLVLLGFISSNNAKIVCIEEPELNLSFKNQDYVVSALQSLLEQAAGPTQIILTSHSDHIGSRDDLQQWHVELIETKGTSASPFKDEDRDALFPRASEPKRKAPRFDLPDRPLWDHD